jgi:hypothetical protein
MSRQHWSPRARFHLPSHERIRHFATGGDTRRTFEMPDRAEVIRDATSATMDRAASFIDAPLRKTAS